MKMITFSKLRQLALAALCTCGISAHAQFTGSLEQYGPTSNYEAETATFKMTEVATTLGTDTTTLRTALDEWIGHDDNTNSMFFLVNPTDGSLTDNYTATPKLGFWMGNDCTPVSYGETAKIFGEFGYDTSNGADKFYINVGQYPNALSADTTFKPKFALKYGDKQATFDISFHVKAIPAAPSPTTTVKSKLNIVGSYAVPTVVRKTNQGYDATTIGFPAGDIISKLGADKSLFSVQLSSTLYAEKLDSLGTIADSLTNNSTANAPGWWLKRSVYPQGHEKQGETAPELGASNYGSDCHIFIQGFAYNEENDSLTCELGQYPGTPVAGDSVSANIYIMYGDKAYKLNYTCVFQEAESIGLSDMTSVGNTNFDVTIYDDEADYSYQEVTIDVDAIAAALGCATSAINMTTLKEEGQLYVGTGTANLGGFWLNEDGFACSWGESAATCFQPTKEGDYTSMQLMLFPNKQANVGSTYKGAIYFTYDTKYYTVSYSINVARKSYSIGQKDWKVVNEHAAVVQVIADASQYIADGNQTTYTLSADQITSDLGTSSYTMYCDLADSLVTDSTLYAKYSSYPCDPAPGIWFNADGKGSGYNGTQTVGICWDSSDGTFDVYQMPGNNASGSNWTGNIYFVDEENGKMSLVKFTVQFVDEIKSAEIVGTEDIVLAVAYDKERTANIDLSKPATALGITADELLNGSYAKGLLSSGIYGSAVNITTTGVSFDSKGNYAADGFINVIIDNTNGTPRLSSYSSNTIAEDYKATAKFCFEVNEKQYVYNLTLVSDKQYTGISDVKASLSAKSDKVYDLSGRLVVRPVKGLYIKNGKKYVVK